MKSKKIKKLSVPATSLQNDDTSAQVFPANKDFGKFLTTGNWTKTNSEKDKKIEDLATFIEKPPEPFKDSKKQIIVDANKYLKLKDEIARKRRDQNKKTLMYTLIDPRNRETEKMANSMFPELLKTNDEFFRRDLELQKSLYRMIQRGTIETRKELEELYYILTNPDFFLPLGPSWDPNKIIFKRNPFQYYPTARENTIGIWNPKRIFNTYRKVENSLYAYNSKTILESWDNLANEEERQNVIEQKLSDSTGMDQLVLKICFAARICPMFAGYEPSKSVIDFDKILMVIRPILLGVDGLNVDIFEVDPDAPNPDGNENPSFNPDKMEQSDNEN